MKKYYELASALEYIENHLTGNCAQAEIAKAACVSLSALQKLFRYTFGYSVNEYIMKRKMTAAAEELADSSISVAELAFKYGYGSSEAFSRAFCRVNCCLPSDYRRGRRTQAVFTPIRLGENGITRETPVLIDAIHKTQNLYVVCFDVVGIIKINEISREAGDLALMQAVQRIHKYASEETRLFRIGGDEFALITPFGNAADAESLAAAVLAHNGEAFFCKGRAFPLFLRAWYGKNALAVNSANPANLLREKVKYQGITEVYNDKRQR